jgi:hypothetical protein
VEKAMQEAAQAAYGGTFSEASKANLSRYAAQVLYKSASEPTSHDAPVRQRLPPAAVAGVHLAQQGEAFAKEGAGGPGGQRIISYSSEPTSRASAGMSRFPSEPFMQPRNILPQYSAFDLPAGEFASIAWVSVSLTNLEGPCAEMCGRHDMLCFHCRHESMLGLVPKLQPPRLYLWATTITRHHETGPNIGKYHNQRAQIAYP